MTTKKSVITFLVLILVLACLIAVSAVWDSSKTMWHDAIDVKVNYDGVDEDLQEVINSLKDQITELNYTLNSQSSSSGGITECISVHEGPRSITSTMSASCPADYFITGCDGYINTNLPQGAKAIPNSATNSCVCYKAFSGTPIGCTAICCK